HTHWLICVSTSDFIGHSICLDGSIGSFISRSDNSANTLERGSCPPFWFSFDGRCYKYVSSPLTWVDAELYCVAEQANLVSIHSMKEHKFVKSLIENFDHRQGLTWIGLSDTQKESGWMWSDGGKEHCCEINSGPDGNWNDYPCSETLPSVCASRIPVNIPQI
uniref:C-type lectin domain-containing protein n=1 Tax=Neogobius melanostomus TaxID=47308 RepID=A0A8C6SI60_9GOBI